MTKKRRGPWVALVAGVERLVLNVTIGFLVAVVGRQLRKRLRGPSAKVNSPNRA